jgi:hypothetical protein
MIVGRSPRNPVIGDTVLLRAQKRQGIGTVVDTDVVSDKVYWRSGRGELSWHARAELTVPRVDYGRGWHVPVATSTRDGDALESCGGKQVKFHIGDTVQLGTRVGRITDVGTVLIQVKTNDGCLRVACPWEVVRTSSLPRGSAPNFEQSDPRVGGDGAANCA